MKENIIIHIPHSSLNIPKVFYQKIICNIEEIDKMNVFTSDYLVDKFVPKNYKNIIKFNYSRLFCDVERFKDDNLEVMAKYGMGVVYEKDYKGKRFIKIDNDYKNYVIKKYYDKHHKLLDELVRNILKVYDKCYIIDLHSFSDKFVHELLNRENNPDICIGYDDGYCNGNIINKTIEHFKNYGYSVKVNYPYSGSLIPNEYYNRKDRRVCSIMIEINKRIYLDNDIVLNNEKYSKLKKCMDEYYENISKIFI